MGTDMGMGMGKVIWFMTVIAGSSVLVPGSWLHQGCAGPLPGLQPGCIRCYGLVHCMLFVLHD
jgi:hypothetical protein